MDYFSYIYSDECVPHVCAQVLFIIFVNYNQNIEAIQFYVI